MKNYKSTKLFEGYSTAFRQWRASHSHCKFVHGYALKFKVTFEGNLDELNWVCDFGCFKRNGIKEHMKYMFDRAYSFNQCLVDWSDHLDPFADTTKMFSGSGCSYFLEPPRGWCACRG